MSPVALPPQPSASAVSATASSGCHIVKVSGYSQAQLLLGIGEYVESAGFTAAGHTWCIRAYPNGARKECAGGLSLYLKLAGDYSGKDVHATLAFSFVTGKLKKATPPHCAGGSPVTFTASQQEWGFENVVTPDKLSTDDALFVRCDITVTNFVASRHGPEDLGLVCNCADDLCKNLHMSGGKKKAAAAAAAAAAKSQRIDTTDPVSSHDDAAPAPAPLPSASSIAVAHPLLPKTATARSAPATSTSPSSSPPARPAGASSTPRSSSAWCLPALGKKSSSCWGISGFMATKKLESQYLEDDSFLIRCDITAMNKPGVKQ
ncbi:hypothetical protein ACP4OV_001387 [Aristida adscensionis]